MHSLPACPSATTRHATSLGTNADTSTYATVDTHAYPPRDDAAPSALSLGTRL